MEQFNNHQANQINLLDYWRVVWRYKKMIAAVVVTVSILAVVISSFMTKMYKAETIIIPVNAKGGGGLQALASQFGGLAQLSGINMPGVSGDTEKFLVILRSRTLAENVIKREDVAPILLGKNWDAEKGVEKIDEPKIMLMMESSVMKLKGLVAISDDKKNKTIVITGVYKDPEVAARLANAYIEELQNFIKATSLTAAKRNRIFIEGQLEENKLELLEAGKEISDFYRGNRISNVDAKVDVQIGRDDDPLPLIKGRSLPDGQNSTDHGIVTLDVLEMQKTDVEKKLADARIVKNIPQQVYLSYLMLRRELLTKVNALLITQYEMAKIEESKEDLAFQVIDKAVPPVTKFKPKRAQICIMSFIVALLGSILFAFFREHINRIKYVHG